MHEEIRALFEEVLQDYYNDSSFIIDDRCWGEGRRTAMEELNESVADYRQKLDALLKKLLAQTDADCLEQLAGRYALD